MTAMCQWDPIKRPTAVQALQHPYFQVGIRAQPQIQPSPVPIIQQHQQGGSDQQPRSNLPQMGGATLAPTAVRTQKPNPVARHIVALPGEVNPLPLPAGIHG